MDIYNILRVDLSQGNYKEEKVPEDLIRSYIGGKGLAAYYLFKELEPHINPLSPKNKIIFMTGPLTGIYPGTSRYVVVTKSPLTGAFLDSYAGGSFPIELRKTGYIGLIIEGRADDMVYLEINNNEVSINDALNLRGNNTDEVDDKFKGFRVACIGLAGENLVKFACIMNDMGKNSGRSGAAGRGGAGAVMGSKNLKAIVIKGKKKLEVPEKAKEIRKKYTKKLISDENLKIWAKVGGNLPQIDVSNELKILPTRNFKKGYFRGYKKINEEAIEPNLIKKQACPLCPIPCGEIIKAKEGYFEGVEVQELEYETVAMLGSNCEQNDLSTVIKAASLCDKYGIDTITTGAIMAFVMECSEKGLIDYSIDFGNSKKQIELIELIAKRRGIGNILAEGVKKASEKFGGKEFALHVKGLEVPAYDARGSIGMSLSYATSDRGACHMRAWTVGNEMSAELDRFTPDGKAKLVKDLQDFNAALWSLISCDNILNPERYSEKNAVEMLNGIGFNFKEREFLEVGERIYNLTRLFNVREGFSSKDDTLPERFREIQEETKWKISQKDFDKMLAEYYSLRGWDSNGKPKKETLDRLDLIF